MYRGFRLEVEEDREPDNIKLWHYAVHDATGLTFSIDYSPYRCPTHEEFKKIVDDIIDNGKYNI